jgi:O-antigen/teichoic acid export membrane protein
MYASCPGPVWKPERRGLAAQLRFGIPLALETLTGILTLRIGNILVASMCTTGDFAAYSNGAIEIPFIAAVTGSITAIIIPDLARHLKENQQGEALVLWRKAIVKSASILIPLMVFLLIGAHEVITFLFSARYEDSVLPFRILLLLLPARAVQFGALYIAGNRGTWLLAKTVAGFVVATLVTIPFVYIWGAWSAAAATVVVFYLFTVPLNVFFISRIVRSRMHRILPLGRTSRILAASILAGLPTYAAHRLLEGRPGLLVLFATAVVHGIATLLVFHAFGIRELMDLAHLLWKRWRPAGAP